MCCAAKKKKKSLQCNKKQLNSKKKSRLAEKNMTARHTSANELKIDRPVGPVDEPGIDAYEPGVDGYEPGVNGYEPGVNGYEPGVNGYLPGVNGYKPRVNGYEPGVKGELGVKGEPGISVHRTNNQMCIHKRPFRHIPHASSTDIRMFRTRNASLNIMEHDDRFWCFVFLFFLSCLLLFLYIAHKRQMSR